MSIHDLMTDEQVAAFSKATNLLIESNFPELYLRAIQRSILTMSQAVGNVQANNSYLNELRTLSIEYAMAIKLFAAMNIDSQI